MITAIESTMVSNAPTMRSREDSMTFDWKQVVPIQVDDVDRLIELSSQHFHHRDVIERFRFLIY